MKTDGLFDRLAPASRLLLIRLRSMGDCLLLTSPLRALKAQYPGFHVTVAVEARFADCFSHNPDVDEVFELRRKTDALRLFGRRFEGVLNLHGGPTSLMLALLARGPRIGFEQFQYRWLYQGLLPSPDPTRHTVEATFSAFQRLGLRQATPPPLRYERQDCAPPRIDGAYAVIHPAALMATKRWEASRFAKLAVALQQTGLQTVLTCGPGEEAAVEAVVRESPASHTAPGLGIAVLAELIRGARLFAGNDSGPMHLAAAVGTPVLALWGSSDSRRWRPWTPAHTVVQNPFECNPCPGYRCLVAPTPLCIESVTVDQAIAAARRLLELHAHSAS